MSEYGTLTDELVEAAVSAGADPIACRKPLAAAVRLWIPHAASALVGALDGVPFTEVALRAALREAAGLTGLRQRGAGERAERPTPGRDEFGAVPLPGGPARSTWGSSPPASGGAGSGQRSAPSGAGGVASTPVLAHKGASAPSPSAVRTPDVAAPPRSSAYSSMSPHPGSEAAHLRTGPSSTRGGHGAYGPHGSALGERIYVPAAHPSGHHHMSSSPTPTHTIVYMPAPAHSASATSGISNLSGPSGPSGPYATSHYPTRSARRRSASLSSAAKSHGPVIIDEEDVKLVSSYLNIPSDAARERLYFFDGDVVEALSTHSAATAFDN
jgi:NACalpha-BTF3-like transcription factor